MKINLVSLIAGKTYTIYDYLKMCQMLFASNPEIEWTWYINDNSHNNSLEKRLADMDFNANIIHCIDETPSFTNYDDKGYQNKLCTMVAGLYDKTFKAMPSSDYTLIIEDDIIIDENPIPLMLSRFRDDVAAVSGCTFARRQNGIFGNVQAFVIEDGLIMRVQPKKDGFEDVNGTSFGFLLVKSDILKRTEITSSRGIAQSFDNAFGVKMKEEGKCIVYSWDVRCKHYYKTKDGLVKYLDFDKSPPEKHKVHSMRGMMQVQIPRNSSPLFIYVPKNTIITKELLAKYQQNESN